MATMTRSTDARTAVIYNSPLCISSHAVIATQKHLSKNALPFRSSQRSTGLFTESNFLRTTVNPLRRAALQRQQHRRSSSLGDTAAFCWEKKIAASRSAGHHRCKYSFQLDQRGDDMWRMDLSTESDVLCEM